MNQMGIAGIEQMSSHLNKFFDKLIGKNNGFNNDTNDAITIMNDNQTITMIITDNV